MPHPFSPGPTRTKPARLVLSPRRDMSTAAWQVAFNPNACLEAGLCGCSFASSGTNNADPPQAPRHLMCFAWVAHGPQEYGGGVFVQDGVLFIITSAIFRSNVAPLGGHALYVEEGGDTSSTIANATFVGHSSSASTVSIRSPVTWVCAPGSYMPILALLPDPSAAPARPSLSFDTAIACPYDCSAGYYANATTPTDHASFDCGGPCPRGHYCGPATKVPTPCPLGFYQPGEKATLPLNCIRNHARIEAAIAGCSCCLVAAAAATRLLQ